jgi:hypothetical protein
MRHAATTSVGWVEPRGYLSPSNDGFRSRSTHPAGKRKISGATISARCRPMSGRRGAGVGRRADPIEPGRRGRQIFDPVRARARIRRASDHRRSLPLRLHAGAEHRSERTDLRHVAGDSGLSRRAGGRSARTAVLGLGSHARDRVNLSGAGSRLDRPAWRALPQGSPASRPRARGIVSVLHVGPARLTQHAKHAENCHDAPCPRGSASPGQNPSEFAPTISKRNPS